MSLRRKLALWLCPELAGSVEAQIEYRTLPFPEVAPTTGIHAAIHVGERIIPAADNRELLGAAAAHVASYPDMIKALALIQKGSQPG